MNLKTGDIIAGKRIGDVQIGWAEEDLISYIGNDFKIEERANCIVIEIDNAKFWIDNHNKVYQITVFGDFEGKFLEKIGIGSTLKDVEKYICEWQYDLYVYILKNHEGICFELCDEEEFDELNARIEFISIY